MARAYPVVAIVGRPNVGKSTLFNRVLGTKKAIVEDRAGVTRDRNYALVERFSIPFMLVDTGGLDDHSDDELIKFVHEQALVAIEEADAVIALFDGKEGLQEADRDVVKVLRRFTKPIAYIVNKVDGEELRYERLSDFYSLGLDSLEAMSALHGYAVNEAIESVLRGVPDYQSYRQSFLDRKKNIVERETVAETVVAAMPADDDDDEDLVVASEELDAEFGDDAFLDFPRGEPVFAEVFDTHDESTEIGSKASEEYVRQERVRRDLRIPHRERLYSADGNLLHQPAEDADTDAQTDEPASVVPEELPCIAVALVGRPNVGKSTMLNTFVGERRAITSPLPGTTRDALDLELTRDGQVFRIVDTAGLRKKARVDDEVERFSTMRSVGAISECDVAVIVLDAIDGPQEQDAKIAGLAHERGAGLVIAVNKWDAVEKDHRSVKEMEQKVRVAFKFAQYAPIVFVSALSGRRCPKLLETVKEVAFERERRVSTGALNRVLARAVSRKSAPIYRGRPVKVYFATQVQSAPPEFIFFVNQPRGVHFSYVRYLKNCIRDAFGFEGSDIRIRLRKRGAATK